MSNKAFSATHATSSVFPMTVPKSFQRLAVVLLTFVTCLTMTIFLLPTNRFPSPQTMRQEASKLLSTLEDSTKELSMALINGHYEPKYPSEVKKIENFQRCKMFDGSYFNTSEISETKIAEFIDQRAHDIESRMRRKARGAIAKDSLNLHRYTCYQVAAHKTAPFENLMYKTNMTIYFPQIPFTPQPLIKKYKAKVAYLYMVHGEDGDETQVKRIMTVLVAIRDEDAFVLLHVDKHSDWLFERVREESKQYDNVLLTKNRMTVEWGFSSMVYVELAGFFELMDVAEWDFVINLSAHDYPVRSSSYIHKSLKKDHIYMTHWYDSDTFNDRARSAVFRKENYNWIWYTKRRRFPIESMKRTKHHQWMILPRSYVDYLRTEDHEAQQIMMYMESSVFTDEWFFATTIFREGHPYAEKVINDNKRYISPFKGIHPKPITEEDIPVISETLEKRKFYLIRKVDVLKEPKVIKWLDGVRKESSPSSSKENENL